YGDDPERRGQDLLGRRGERVVYRPDAHLRRRERGGEPPADTSAGGAGGNSIAGGSCGPTPSGRCVAGESLGLQIVLSRPPGTGSSLLLSPYGRRAPSGVDEPPRVVAGFRPTSQAVTGPGASSEQGAADETLAALMRARTNQDAAAVDLYLSVTGSRAAVPG